MMLNFSWKKVDSHLKSSTACLEPELRPHSHLLSQDLCGWALRADVESLGGCFVSLSSLCFQKKVIFFVVRITLPGGRNSAGGHYFPVVRM